MGRVHPGLGGVWLAQHSCQGVVQMIRKNMVGSVIGVEEFSNQQAKKKKTREVGQSLELFSCVQ
jgi:hypothetical protein